MAATTRSPARQEKRDRLLAGLKAPSLGAGEARRTELASFYTRDRQLTRILAQRYAECVVALLDAFPEGDVPDDVIESYVDALARHDEGYAKKLLSTDDAHVLALKGTKTVARRAYQWLDEGDVFELGGRKFRVVKVTRERCEDVTSDEARREGFATIEEWRRAWAEARPRSQAAIRASDEICWRHEFAAIDETR